MTLAESYGHNLMTTMKVTNTDQRASLQRPSFVLYLKVYISIEFDFSVPKIVPDHHDYSG